jgi:hypothetical protein
MTAIDAPVTRSIEVEDNAIRNYIALHAKVETGIPFAKATSRRSSDLSHMKNEPIFSQAACLNHCTDR